MREETTHRHIAETVRALREEKQLTQGQLAALAGVSQQSISTLETETNKSVRLISVYRIAAALGICGIGLQVPDLPAEALKDGSLARLIDLFAQAGAESRAFILQIAEREIP